MRFMTKTYIYAFLVAVNLYGFTAHAVLAWMAHEGRRPYQLPWRYLRGLRLYLIFLPVGFLLFKRASVEHYLKAIETWSKRSTHRRERRIISMAALFLITVYCLKLHLGFYHFGIAGWVRFKPATTPPPSP
ncbi:MAG: hypothetical protein R3C68_10155 [Myxococcota bacterium]